MKHSLALGIALFLALPAMAQDVPNPAETAPEMPLITSDGVDLSEFLWTKRPVVVFADTPNDPRFAQQMQLLGKDIPGLLDRDVIVITDTDPKARSAVRQKLRPRGFMLVMIGKDGGVKLRKPFPWDVREIGRSIDKMPMRQQELRDARQEQ